MSASRQGNDATHSRTAPRIPTAQEIKMKLSSPTSPAAPPPLSLSPPEGPARKIGGSSKWGYTASGSSADEDDPLPPSSPSRHSSALPLSAITEGVSEGTEDASGSDSDGSIDGGMAKSPGGKASRRLNLDRETTRMSDFKAVKSGYLWKQGERRKAWKKRWFVLRGGQLAAYKTEKEYRLLRLVPLTDIHTCAPVELKKHSYTFGIVTPRRTYYVKANSDREVQDWCSAVERGREEVRAASTVTSLDSPLPSGEHTPRIATPGSPRPLSSSTRSVPIPISGPSMSKPQPAYIDTVPSSFTTSVTSTSPSTPFSPNATLLSSSQTSTSTAPNYTPAPPRVPPNSLAQTGPSALGLQTPDGTLLQLGEVDAGLERVAGGRDRREIRSASITSSAGEVSSPGEGTGTSTGGHLNVPNTGYFSLRQGSGHGATPAGAMSSSDDDDGFDTFDGPGQNEGRAVSFMASGASAARLLGGAQQSARPEEGTRTIYSGYLMKQGKRKTWRKRWFVLMSDKLVYSRSHMDSKIHRQIPISRILGAIEYSPPTPPANSRRTTGVAPLSPSLRGPSGPTTGEDSKRHYENCFKIITPKRTYLVCATSEEEEIKWLAALQCLVARKSGAQSITSPRPAQTGAGPTQKPATATDPSTGAGPAEGNKPLAADANRQTTLASAETPLAAHGRQRSVTDAEKAAVREVERRFQNTHLGKELRT